jgi:hypothetical protein
MPPTQTKKKPTSTEKEIPRKKIPTTQTKKNSQPVKIFSEPVQ